MKIINYKDKQYPEFQSEGNAAQFAIPYAKKFCQGYGVDIGCNKEEWKFPNSIGIDLNIFDDFDAFNFPYEELDYIFSSHCLEHLNDWIGALDYWTSKLKSGGVLFLYLPHYDQEYWRPWNNKKHLHVFTPQIIIDYMKDRGYVNIFNSEKDLNHSFMIVGEKK